MSDIFNFFPLTIYKSKIGLGHDERSLLIDEVYNLEKDSDKLKSNNKQLINFNKPLNEVCFSQAQLLFLQHYLHHQTILVLSYS